MRKKNQAHLKITEREFETLVRNAIRSLPREFKRKLENINLVIREEPSVAQKQEAGTASEEELLGLYEGIPLGERTHCCGSVLPDKITVFRGPLRRSCRSRKEIRQAVQDTVLHEFAHYFGISDEQMIDDGTY